MSIPGLESVLPILFDAVEIRAGQTPLLSDLSLAIGAGPPTVLIGPNGSGKTTLLKAAMGLIAPNAGSIKWGMSLLPPARRLAMVFQRPVMLRRSCAGNLRYALLAAGAARTQREREVTELLQLVGLQRLADRPARRLSGGEQQRLALARALARKPAVLFLDEPTASLDPAATQAIEDLVRDVSSRGVKVVMSTHDLGEARRLAGEIILLHHGAVAESRPAHQFFAGPSSEAARRFLAGELLT